MRTVNPALAANMVVLAACPSPNKTRPDAGVPGPDADVSTPVRGACGVPCRNAP